MGERQIYLDHASTTPIDPRVGRVMKPFIERLFGNASSFHTPGKIARDAVENARSEVAQVLGARSDEVIFTSGGTQADNLAILGFARANYEHGNHLISVATEHPAVLQPLRHLAEKEGFEITILPVDKDGRVDAEAVIAAIKPETILISVMLANNEIGTLGPVKQIAGKLKKFKQQEKRDYPFLHTDACQAVGALEVDVKKLGVDLMTVNSSKIYGPKGVGALYLKRGLKIEPLEFGGDQERTLRPGTENMIGIVGFGEAIKIAEAERENYVANLTPLRDYLSEQILSIIPKTRLNGHPTERLPNIVNISFLDIEGEALLLYLDAQGIFASTGSACTSSSLEPSHVIRALGLPFEAAHGSLRFSLGRSTTKKDIDYVVKVLPPLVEKLRKMSPVSVDPKYF